jgi:7-cyano-7-deazaguanine synthase in queuosine biosynthesis
MKQTAVEFAVNQLEQLIPFGHQLAVRIILEQAIEMEKQQIIEHSVELAKLLFSNPIEKSGTTPQELVGSYFKNK